jgi:tetratricopeptide (TPR) repeat protein
MKHLILILSLCSVLSAAGQNMNIQNMQSYLRGNELEKAKAAADAAAVHETTAKSAKMWMYRGNVYKAISDTSARDAIDPEAEEKALDAYINCLKLDKDNNIYKDDVKGNLVRAAAATRNKANYYKVNGKFDKSLKCLELLEASLPFDFDGGIKRNNITKEKLMFERFLTYRKAGDRAKAKEIADQLIGINYKDPLLFTDMVDYSLKQKDTTEALKYIEKGRSMFEENESLMNSELNIYLARKKSDVLKEKLKAAIEIAPDNEVLHVVLANLYKNTGQREEAEKEYLKAIELKPDFALGHYQLGVLYYSQGKEWNDKLNDLKPGDKREKEYQAKSNEHFKKAVGYFETYYDATKDPDTKKLLRQLFVRLQDTEKAEKYK